MPVQINPTENKQITKHRAQRLKNDFKAITAVINPMYDNLPSQRKTAALNTFQNWASATSTQREEALAIAVGLLISALDALVDGG